MSQKRRELFRDPRRGKIAGVCAGLSDYFNMELWLVRILFITAVLLSGPFFVVIYVACWFILDRQPAEFTQHVPKEELHEERVNVKFKVWQKGEPPRQALYELKDRFTRLDGRIQKLETYVTSPEFTVSREIDRL
ncbi:envelope stress response membrane protein PspC [Pseudoalteromonas xiamenensis]|uniref:envelope stress response membrane protein PspC n=1 Tax=Pseudoalteromonas xiamenensis TaxID=882626 RepID=UPI0027E5900C|nr:envelope stress response membrane protein PspC [Pseudoalteromonas xiamenensis]WMN60429.1 envelope stress response membrane protein PspC [Pseudoalteromonas xiamenensis]